MLKNMSMVFIIGLVVGLAALYFSADDASKNMNSEQTKKSVSKK